MFHGHKRGFWLILETLHECIRVFCVTKIFMAWYFKILLERNQRHKTRQDKITYLILSILSTEKFKLDLIWFISPFLINHWQLESKWKWNPHFFDTHTTFFGLIWLLPNQTFCILIKKLSQATQYYENHHRPLGNQFEGITSQFSNLFHSKSSAEKYI